MPHAPRHSLSAGLSERRPARQHDRHLHERGGGAGSRRGEWRRRATPTPPRPPTLAPALAAPASAPASRPSHPPPPHARPCRGRRAVGRGGCPRRHLRLSGAGRAELVRGGGRPEALRARGLDRARPLPGPGPARRRLSRHGAAGRLRAVQEHPATRRKPPPIAVTSEASPPPALTETEPVITAPSSPVAGIAGAGGGALDGGRTWLGLVDK